MNRASFLNCTLRYGLAVLLLAAGMDAQSAADAAKKRAGALASPAAVNAGPALEPKAIEILKATSSRLVAAHSMTFTADVSYESPTRQGPPLVLVTQSDVTLVRPNK